VQRGSGLQLLLLLLLLLRRLAHVARAGWGRLPAAVCVQVESGALFGAV
jgi:hypothetical protein